jgi:hypothetical protein
MINKTLVIALIELLYLWDIRQISVTRHIHQLKNTKSTFSALAKLLDWARGKIRRI